MSEHRISMPTDLEYPHSDSYVYLGIFKPLLQILVDCFIRDLADEGKI